MLRTPGLLFSVLLASCHDAPKQIGVGTSARLPVAHPDSVLAAPRAPSPLDTLLRLAQERPLVSYSSARALPPRVAAYLQTQEGGADSSFVLADVGARFQVTDVVLEPGLPRHQLVYLGVSPDVVLVSYYSGGVGLMQSVGLFRLQGQAITQGWLGYVPENPKTKAELLRQVRMREEERMRGQ
ncbi:hypothetical protein [Hymenobacter sp. YC55]|uniref:hypothetical protein n=1 Tax=Hymenobacter sp. YC55 TaxID=3034019 RepID=UPI0023F6F2A8|nr:hypothetical protein [Hymenobacter sp. YC55]MDF7815696.1 hypothetical protein [Hymenobacter sp. YC55]